MCVVAPLGPYFVDADDLAAALTEADAGEELTYPSVSPFNAAAELTAFGAVISQSEISAVSYDVNVRLLEVLIRPAIAPRLRVDETRLPLQTLACRAEEGPSGKWLTSEVFEQRLLDGFGRELLPPVSVETIVEYCPQAAGGAICAHNRTCKYTRANTLAGRFSGRTDRGSGVMISAFDYDWTLEPIADEDVRRGKLA
ncbi:hypothetical protein T492DRAFT_838216 [Pavlovales sp. CCMP2436]|nr:hypothetical protein T492DRAFT_838216 [Pavlovales sp. CCMP2436]